MALQNKVLPSGEIVAKDMRGQFMGNRGGRFHDPHLRQLHPTRRWASRQWICCLTSFKSRHRTVMGNSYTELFFLDEVTALAAGHRPCFECRRRDAMHFAECMAHALGLDRSPKAPEMDKILHQQRLGNHHKCQIEVCLNELPDGAMFLTNDQFFAVRKNTAYRWSLNGYDKQPARLEGSAYILTPPAVVDVLKAGYQPSWHKIAAGS